MTYMTDEMKAINRITSTMRAEQIRPMIQRLIRSQELRTQEAFITSISGISSAVTLAAIYNNLADGNIEGALAAMAITAGSFAPLINVIRQTYVKSTDINSLAIPPKEGPSGHQMVFTFNTRNLDAEGYLTSQSGTMITPSQAQPITDDMLNGIRTFMTDSLSQGKNPRTIALDIMGRVNASGVRTGGLLGLSDNQIQWRSSYETALRNLDGRSLGMRSDGTFANYTLRNLRWDRTVANAIRNGQPLTEKQITNLLQGYTNKALLYRGKMIGRTETIRALNAASVDTYKQAVSDGFIKQEDTTKIWRATHDERTRDTHLAMDGQKVAMNQPFHSPSGAELMFPGDPSAPGSETINCRCWIEHHVDFLAGIE